MRSGRAKGAPERLRSIASMSHNQRRCTARSFVVAVASLAAKSAASTAAASFVLLSSNCCSNSDNDIPCPVSVSLFITAARAFTDSIKLIMVSHRSSFNAVTTPIR